MLAVGIDAIVGLETTVVVWMGVSGTGRGATNGGADAGATIGDGKAAVGVSAKGPTYVCDWVRARAPTRYGVGGIPRLNSTISSSKRFLLIERCELHCECKQLRIWWQFFLFPLNF